MKLSVKLYGFAEGRGQLKRMQRGYRRVAAAALLDFGNEAVQKLKNDASAGAFGPPKRKDDGKPPLIDTFVYINSYKAVAVGELELAIIAEGDNLNMSNAALAELLEYGSTKIAARPHLRVLGVWAEANMPTKVGEKIARGLSRGF